MINVVGDVGLVLARLPHLPRARARSTSLAIFEPGAARSSRTNEGDVVAICLLLLVGAFAKSAQVPLHTWLPDAMEGPTPVSALIHAATMVTAGVYLIARMHPLFELGADGRRHRRVHRPARRCCSRRRSRSCVTDLKRIIAYSTMSQIGYMIVGVSIGAYAAGLFHLMTHAFFKALLFMAAGSVIAAMARQPEHRPDGRLPQGDAVHLGDAADRRPGARRASRGTSGFFSKDEILAFAADRGGCYWIFAIGGYVGALLTAFYAFRIVFRVVLRRARARRRASSSRATSHHAEPEQPGDRRARGHRRRLPRARAPHRRARVADEGRDGASSAFGALVRRPASRSRASTTSIDQLPRRRPSRDSQLSTIEPSTRDRVASGLLIGGADLGRSASRIAYCVYVRRPGIDGARSQRALRARCTTSSSTSGTSTSRSTSLVVPPGARGRPLRQRDLRARRRPGARRRRRPTLVARRRRRRPRRPVRLPALLRAAAGRRLRRRSASTSCLQSS